MSDFEDWENIIHFGNSFVSIWEKIYFLALGNSPIKGVCFIAEKITVRHNEIYSIVGKALMLEALRWF